MLPQDAGAQQTVVAVAIAKLSEPAVVVAAPVRGSFGGTGKAVSVAAGRLSYVYGLKVGLPGAARWLQARQCCTGLLHPATAQLR